MSYIAKLTIPKIQDRDDLKLYVYRSKNADDINTISKVSNMQPVIVIDQSQAETVVYNNKPCYVVEDRPTNTEGVVYNGPVLNTVPLTEYETEINLIKYNVYTHFNELVLSPLPLTNNNGIIFYYSVIAVDESNNLMSHLSKVNGVLVNYISKEDITRELWSCNDYQDSNEDVWIYVNNIEYNSFDEQIKIGDINRSNVISRFGIPVVETVPSIQEVNADTNSLVSNTYMTLKVQNPWQHNNEHFNYRKLKSYKVRNTYGYIYGEFSIPTYQSSLPVSIEKMVIVMKENPSNVNNTIDIDDNNAKKIEIIRKDGIFYEPLKHKDLGFNLWNIPLENNKLAIFSESSVQETINIQLSGVLGNIYVFDIYLIDVYKNISENKHYILET